MGGGDISRVSPQQRACSQRSPPALWSRLCPGCSHSGTVKPLSGDSAPAALPGHSHQAPTLPPARGQAHVSRPQRCPFSKGPGEDLKPPAHNWWHRPPREFGFSCSTAAPSEQPGRVSPPPRDCEPRKCPRHQHQRRLFQQHEPGRKRVNPITGLTPSHSVLGGTQGSGPASPAKEPVPWSSTQRGPVPGQVVWNSTTRPRALQRHGPTRSSTQSHGHPTLAMPREGRLSRQPGVTAERATSSAPHPQPLPGTVSPAEGARGAPRPRGL